MGSTNRKQSTAEDAWRRSFEALLVVVIVTSHAEQTCSFLFNLVHSCSILFIPVQSCSFVFNLVQFCVLPQIITKCAIDEKAKRRKINGVVRAPVYSTLVLPAKTWKEVLLQSSTYILCSR